MNHVALDAILGQATDYEVDLAIQQVEKTHDDDVIIADRGDASYFFLARLTQAGRAFIVRCSSGSFKAATAMLAGQGAARQRVTRIAPPTPKELTAVGLPTQLTVRLVRVYSETGGIVPLIDIQTLY